MFTYVQICLGWSHVNPFLATGLFLYPLTRGIKWVNLAVLAICTLSFFYCSFLVTI